MKALRWHDRRDMRIDDVPEPSPGKGEVKIEVLYSGICGSEVHEFTSGPIFIPLDYHPLTQTRAPQIMGHEFGGRIVELGKGVKGLSVGDKVAVNPILSCGECFFCKKGHINHCTKLAYYGLIGDGGHAEYAVVKADNCVALPQNCPDEFVAFGEPAGVALHAVRRGCVGEGQNVVVIGGGPVGLLTAQYAKVAGAKNVWLSEIAPRRIECARKLKNIDDVFNPLETDVVNAILEHTDGVGADVVLEVCGGKRAGVLEDTALLAIELTRGEGTTVIVGTFSHISNLHFNQIVLMERNVVGSWVWQNEFDEALNMIVDGKIDVKPLITDCIPLGNAVIDGVIELEQNKGEHIKVLISPHMK